MQFQFGDPNVPRAYDDILVPRLFEPWANLLLDRLSVQSGQAVLDVACGPGTVARLAAARVGPRGRVCATDVSEHMLAVARSKLAVPNATPVEYVLSPAVPLAVPSAAFDVVTCQQGFQFFPDRPAALAEMLRALRPGGRVGLSVWAPIDACPFYAALHAILCEVLPRTVADAMLAPFALGDGAAIAALVERAGFRDITVEPHAIDLVFEGGIAQAISSLQATPLAPEIAALPDEARVQLVAAAERHLSLLGDAGAVRAPMRSNVVTARRG